MEPDALNVLFHARKTVEALNVESAALDGRYAGADDERDFVVLTRCVLEWHAKRVR